MSAYDPPRVIVPVFNPANYQESGGISLAFADDRYVQLVKGSQNIVGNISISGSLSTNSIKTDDGTPLSPAYSFTSTSNTGMYYASARLSFAYNGGIRLSIDNSNVVFWTSRVQAVGRGTAPLPFYTFQSDSTAGMWLDLSNALCLSAGGVQQLALSTSNILASSPFIIPNGTLAVPGLAFTTTQNTGLSFVGQDFQLGYGGIQRLAMNTKGTVIGKPSGGTEMTFIRRIAPTATITLNSNTSGTITIPIGVTLANTNYDIIINIISVSGPADHMTYAYDTKTTTDFRVVYKNNGSGSVDFQIQCYLYGY